MHKVYNGQQVYNHKINPNKIVKWRYETKEGFYNIWKISIIHIKGQRRLKSCKGWLNYHIYTRYIEVGQQASVYKIHLNKIVRNEIKSKKKNCKICCKGLEYNPKA